MYPISIILFVRIKKSCNKGIFFGGTGGFGGVVSIKPFVISLYHDESFIADCIYILCILFIFIFIFYFLFLILLLLLLLLHKIDIIIFLILLYTKQSISYLLITYMHDAPSSSTVSSTRRSVSSSSSVSSLSKLIQEYTSTLTPFEQKGLAIAKDHLGPSFDMKRSSGFVRWKDIRDAKASGK